MKAPPLLEASGLRVAFARDGREIAVIDGIGYRLTAGKTLAIVGESGAGKTLSCRALLGLLPPNAVVSGSARFEGNELLTLSERDRQRLRGKGIAMVFQDPARSLNPTMRVGHQVAEAIRVHATIGWKTARDRAIERLTLLRFGRPEVAYRSYPHQLSGGMQQRIMIAIALAGDPKLLIADEATRSLDVTTQAEIMALLMELQSGLGMALILISHDLKLAAAFADDVLVMQAGRCVEYEPASTFVRGARMPYSQALLGAALRPRSNASAEPRARAYPAIRTGSMSITSCNSLLSAHDIVQEYQATSRGARDIVRAVSGVSFDLYSGEALGLVGETGAGKSTLARALLLEPRPKSGSVILNGVDLTQLGRRELAKLRCDLQIVFQDPYGSLNPKWTVASIVEEPLIGLGIAKRAERKRRVREVLELVGLPFADYGQRLPGTLSGGQCQRVAIARALAPNPRIIILDEALSSLDALIQRQMLALLMRLRTELGVALLMIAHDLAQVGAVCDRIAVMRAGRLCEIGPTDALYSTPSHPYTAALLASIPDPASRDRLISPRAVVGETLATSHTSGCSFRHRCPKASSQCENEPELRPIGQNRLVACHSPIAT